jgi:hypothetical protein
MLGERRDDRLEAKKSGMQGVEAVETSSEA